MKKLLALLIFVVSMLTASAQTYRYTGPAGDEQVIDITVVDAVPPADYYKLVNEAMLKRQWPGGLSMRIDSLLKTPFLESTQLGLVVYDLTADRPLYRHGERQMLRPASTMKVLTAVTALSTLDEDYRFSTSLYLDGTIADGTLQGDIYCVGSMDPMITKADMADLVRQLADRGVKRIRGRIIVDKTMLDAEEEAGEGWCWDDDNPTLSPLLVGRKDEFASQLVMALRKARIDVNAPRSKGEMPRVSGSGSSKSGSSKSSAADNAPAVHLQRIASIERPLDDVLLDMMKKSDNLYAESVFYQLAAASGERPARGKAAAKCVREFIDELMPYDATFRVADGSGLSLYNYVTADIEVMVLRHAWRNKKVYERLLPLMPIAGVDGTLKRRMLSGPAHANVRAKTGTLTGIISLAGYCTASNGHTLAFAIINQGVMNDRQARQFQDTLCKLMCDYYE